MEWVEKLGKRRVASRGNQTPKHAHILVDELGLQEASGLDVTLGPVERLAMDATREPMNANEAR